MRGMRLKGSYNPFAAVGSQVASKQTARSKSTIPNRPPTSGEAFEVTKFGFGKDEHYDIDWNLQAPRATDIAIGPQSDIWGINDQIIWTYRKEDQDSVPVESPIVDPIDIDVGPDGSVWICSKAGDIWQRKDNVFV